MPFKDDKTAHRTDIRPRLNRMLISVGVLTILLGLVLISIARRPSTSNTPMQLQQMVGSPMELKSTDKKNSSKSQSSSTAPLVAVGDLVFAGTTKAWMHNYEGELLLTQDAGESWTTIGGDVPRDFDAFTIIDGFYGWAVDNEGKIWKTVDGGYNWKLTSQLQRLDSSESYMSAVQVLFTTHDKGWVVDTFAVWRTSDGGLSWQEVNEFSYMRFRNQVHGMYFLDSRLGWAICEEGLVIHTDDGGDHWRSIVDGLPFNIGTTINVARFLDENRGWISVSDASNPFPENVVLHTEDGGTTWNRHKEIGSHVVIHDIFFLNEKTGWMVGGIKKGYSGFETGVFFATEDGGKTWRRIKTAPIDDGINSVRFTSPEEGWLTTDYSVYRTHDGGKTWSSVLSYPDVKLRNEKILGTE